MYFIIGLQNIYLLAFFMCSFFFPSEQTSVLLTRKLVTLVAGDSENTDILVWQNFWKDMSSVCVCICVQNVCVCVCVCVWCLL